MLGGSYDAPSNVLARNLKGKSQESFRRTKACLGQATLNASRSRGEPFASEVLTADLRFDPVQARGTEDPQGRRPPETSWNLSHRALLFGNSTRSGSALSARSSLRVIFAFTRPASFG